MAETESAQEDDQSMEEILQSIRRIIAEDDEEGENAAEASGEAEMTDVAEESDNEAKGSDILELTDVVEEEPAAEPEAEAPAEVTEEPAPQADVLQDIDAALTSDDSPQAEPAPAIDDDSILSEATASAASEALKNIKKAPTPSVSADPLAFRSGTTMEDLVAETMRPMLKEWLDQNLPDLVERIVEREVKKLTQ